MTVLIWVFILIVPYSFIAAYCGAYLTGDRMTFLWWDILKGNRQRNEAFYRWFIKVNRYLEDSRAYRAIKRLEP